MDAQQNFVGVQPSSILQMLNPRLRASLEYMSLFIAIFLFCFLVFMHVHYVNQPACSREFSGFVTTGADLMLIKITSAGLWLHNESETNRMNVLDLKTVAVQWLENKSKTYEPTYLYSAEQAYFFLSENAKVLHDIRSMNISISAGDSCFGNRWQQVLINRLVGYDTILINSLLSSPGQGFLYNYQTMGFYNLGYAHGSLEGLTTLGDKFVTKCGILLMSFFVFFTATTSTSVVLRETQKQMLQFIVKLRRHVLHGLPILQLILVHLLETVIFVPIMIGILFFLFELYDQQLAFMVLAVVWLCELFVIISVRTPMSMKFFPLFFFLYFMVFHMYLFIYPNGFTNLAMLTMVAFTQHLILYFWNRFELPAFLRFIALVQGSRQNPQEYQIIRSTAITTTLRITRLNARDQGSPNTDVTMGSNPSVHQNAQPGNNPEQQQPQRDLNPSFMSSFRAWLVWIVESSSYVLNSVYSIFRGVRNSGQVPSGPPEDEVFSDAHE